MTRKTYIRTKPKDYSYRNNEVELNKRRLRGKRREGNIRDIFPRLMKVCVDNQYVLVYCYSILSVRELLNLNVYYLIKKSYIPKPRWYFSGIGLYTEDELVVLARNRKALKEMDTKEKRYKVKEKIRKEMSKLKDGVDFKRIEYLRS